MTLLLNYFARCCKSRESESTANAPLVHLSHPHLLTLMRRVQEGFINYKPVPFLSSLWNCIPYKCPCTGAWQSEHPNSWDIYVSVGQWGTAILLRLWNPGYLHMQSHPSRTREPNTRLWCPSAHSPHWWSAKAAYLRTSEWPKIQVKTTPLCQSQNNTFQSQCVRWKGSGVTAMQQWKIWNEFHRRTRSRLQAFWPIN